MSQACYPVEGGGEKGGREGVAGGRVNGGGRKGTRYRKDSVRERLKVGEREEA